MGYIRRERQYIDVSYPKSDTGGYKSVAIDVEVYVDTDAYEDSVDMCEINMDELTEAVVATKVAQLETIQQNAMKVGNTIVDGFYKSIRSDITQQSASLRLKIDAYLVSLQNSMQRCKNIINTMEKDYNRKKRDYTYNFEHLNENLKTRILELDEPVFKFANSVDYFVNKRNRCGVLTSAIVSSKENAMLEARLSASIAKADARNVIHKIVNFLTLQKMNDILIKHCMFNENVNSTIYAPVMYFQAKDNASSKEELIYNKSILEAVNKQRILDKAQKNESPIDWDGVREIYKLKVAKTNKSDDSHQLRVKEYMIKLFNQNNS